MNNESSRLMELYIRRVLREVQAGQATRDRIHSQLEDHILCAVEDSWQEPEIAVRQAVKELGDPVAVGREFNRAYAIHMGFADLARIIGPWLVAPALALAFYLDLVGYNFIFPSWALLLNCSLYAGLAGSYIGNRFSKKSLCIYSCALPSVVFLCLYGAASYMTFQLKSGSWFAVRVMSRGVETLICAGVWAVVFTLSCLWEYSEVAFSSSQRRTFQCLTFVVSICGLCGLLGLLPIF